MSMLAGTHPTGIKTFGPGNGHVGGAGLNGFTAGFSAFLTL